MKRRNLSLRTRTRTSQILNAGMQLVKDASCHRIMTSYNLHINNPKYLVNMDETAIYLNCAPKCTVDLKGEKAVSVMIGCSSSMRFALAVMGAMDGTTLPPFVIFKGKKGATGEKQLPSILPDGVFGCVQKKAWTDNNTMSIWYNKVYKPHIANYDGHSGLLLDDFKCHKGDELRSAMHDDNAMRFMISPHYTGVLQPCDVGINKSLKDRLKKAASDWRRKKHDECLPGQKIPSPKRKDVCDWLKKIWAVFPVEIVKNSFTGSGYYYIDGIDYTGETESESDLE